MNNATLKFIKRILQVPTQVYKDPRPSIVLVHTQATPMSILHSPLNPTQPNADSEHAKHPPPHQVKASRHGSLKPPTKTSAPPPSPPSATSPAPASRPSAHPSLLPSTGAQSQTRHPRSSSPQPYHAPTCGSPRTTPRPRGPPC